MRQKERNPHFSCARNHEGRDRVDEFYNAFNIFISLDLIWEYLDHRFEFSFLDLWYLFWFLILCFHCVQIQRSLRQDYIHLIDPRTQMEQSEVPNNTTYVRRYSCNVFQQLVILDFLKRMNFHEDCFIYLFSSNYLDYKFLLEHF